MILYFKYKRQIIVYQNNFQNDSIDKHALIKRTVMKTSNNLQMPYFLIEKYILYALILFNYMYRTKRIFINYKSIRNYIARQYASQL